MGFHWLHGGVLGALESALLAALVGAVAACCADVAGRRGGWRTGTEIGVALLIALVLGAGVDAWHLFRLGIVRLEYPFGIGRTLDAIHDPDSLGLRVVLEFAGAVIGVMAGWWLCRVVRRHRS
jgi:hypothetical protein